MYTVICDNCGHDSNENGEYSGWSDSSYAVDVAKDCEFEEIDDKHYCPNCYEYDDDDKLIIKDLDPQNVHKIS